MSIDAKQSLFALAFVMVLCALFALDDRYDLPVVAWLIPVLMAGARWAALRLQDGPDAGGGL